MDSSAAAWESMVMHGSPLGQAWTEVNVERGQAFEGDPGQEVHLLTDWLDHGWDLQVVVASTDATGTPGTQTIHVDDAGVVILQESAS